MLPAHAIARLAQHAKSHVSDRQLPAQWPRAVTVCICLDDVQACSFSMTSGERSTCQQGLGKAQSEVECKSGREKKGGTSRYD